MKRLDIVMTETERKTAEQPWNDPSDPNSPAYDSPWEKAAAIIEVIRGAQFDLLHKRDPDDVRDEITGCINRLDELCELMIKTPAGLLMGEPTEEQATATPCTACGTGYGACTDLVLGEEKRACCSRCAYTDTHNAPRDVSPQAESDPGAPSELPPVSENEWFEAVRFIIKQSVDDLASDDIDSGEIADLAISRMRAGKCCPMPAPSTDREKLIGEHPDGASDEREYQELGALSRWLRGAGQEHHFYADRVAIAVDELKVLRAALASPVEVDETKLADVLVRHPIQGYSPTLNHDVCFCGWMGPRHADHLAQMAAEWLRGDGR